MPNWVATKITFPCTLSDGEFNDIIKRFTSDGRTLDFNKIIPMPDYIYRGPLGQEEMGKYGENNWYDWSVKNWGTKWNTSNGKVDRMEKTFTFDTAWSFAEPVIRVLAMITGCEIEAIYADEDLGHNCGRVDFLPDGEVDDYMIMEDSDDAWEIAGELWDITQDELEEEDDDE